MLAPGTIADAPQAHVPGTVQEVILNPEGSIFVVETLNGCVAFCSAGGMFCGASKLTSAHFAWPFFQRHGRL